MGRPFIADPRPPLVIEYDCFVKSTDVAEPSFERYMLGLVGEIGEIAEKKKKELRGDGELLPREYLKELGDVVWYLVRMAHLHGSSLEEVLIINMEKLRKRKDQGMIKGNGDNRGV